MTKHCFDMEKVKELTSTMSLFNKAIALYDARNQIPTFKAIFSLASAEEKEKLLRWKISPEGTTFLSFFKNQQNMEMMIFLLNYDPLFLTQSQFANNPALFNQILIGKQFNDAQFSECCMIIDSLEANKKAYLPQREAQQFDNHPSEYPLPIKTSQIRGQNRLK